MRFSLEPPSVTPYALNHVKRKSARQLLNKVQSAQWLFRHSINRTYYAQKKINGKRKEHSLDTRDWKMRNEGLTSGLQIWRQLIQKREK